jgi:hypothetical protein
VVWGQTLLGFIYRQGANVNENERRGPGKQFFFRCQGKHFRSCDSTRRWKPPLAPGPQGTSPVGSPRRRSRRDPPPLRELQGGLQCRVKIIYLEMLPVSDQFRAGPVAALPRPCSPPGRSARAGSPFAAPPLLDLAAPRKKNCKTRPEGCGKFPGVCYKIKRMFERSNKRKRRFS